MQRIPSEQTQNDDQCAATDRTAAIDQRRAVDKADAVIAGSDTHRTKYAVGAQNRRRLPIHVRLPAGGLAIGQHQVAGAGEHGIKDHPLRLVGSKAHRGQRVGGGLLRRNRIGE